MKRKKTTLSLLLLFVAGYLITAEIKSSKAKAQNLSLKYIASFAGGKASVGLQSIDAAHNFANLSGKDNAVLFFTDRYSEQPLVIKGAGAGADVTAAGVFADIIRASRT